MTPLTPDERAALERETRDMRPPAPPPGVRGMDERARAAAARRVEFVEAGGGEG